MLLTMPHLQDDTAQEQHRKETIAGANGIDSTSSAAEELPIQVARPNFLGTSDPVVAMAKKVSVAMVDASFESVEGNQCGSLSSPSPRRITKGVITPSSSIGNADDVSSADAESVSSRKTNFAPILTMVHGDSRLSQPPLPMKRRVSQIEDGETPVTAKRQLRSSPTSESSRPAIIRSGSSLKLGNADADADMNVEEKEVSETTAKRVKCEVKADCAVGVGRSSGTGTVGQTLTADSVAAAATMAAMTAKTPITSSKASVGKVEVASNAIRQQPPVGHHPNHVLHQNFHPGVVAPPAFHPHPAAFGGYPYGPMAGYPMGYHGYAPHVPPGAVPPLTVGQFHGHPAAGGFYAPYPPSYHPHPMHQQSGQHLPHFVPPYAHRKDVALSAAKTSSNKVSSNSEAKDDKNNQMGVVPSVYVRSNSALDRSTSSTTSSKSEGVLGKPASANRCVSLQEPVPSKSWGKAAIAESAVLPDFHRLVNYPDYLSKSRSVVSGDTAASGGSKTVGGKKHCVMCGKLRICSASSLIEKGRAAVSGDDGTAHIIPRQNKGLCTACDVTVWVLVSDGVEIKWCKGCKNFRQWAAFGDKGSATKCVRCRERQREKYAMQKNAKQTRHADKIGVTAKSLQRGFSSSSLPPPSSSNQRIGSVEEKEENHFAAARGLTSLMNAAAAL